MKNKTKSTSKGVGVAREISSMEKKIVKDIVKEYKDEGKPELVELAAENAKLVFQGFVYAEQVKIDLTRDFNLHVEQRIKEIELQKSCRVRQQPIFLYETLHDFKVKRRTGFETKVMMIGTIIIICIGDHDKMVSKVTTLT